MSAWNALMHRAAHEQRVAHEWLSLVKVLGTQRIVNRAHRPREDDKGFRVSRRQRTPMCHPRHVRQTLKVSSLGQHCLFAPVTVARARVSTPPSPFSRDRDQAVPRCSRSSACASRRVSTSTGPAWTRVAFITTRRLLGTRRRRRPSPPTRPRLIY